MVCSEEVAEAPGLLKVAAISSFKQDLKVVAVEGGSNHKQGHHKVEGGSRDKQDHHREAAKGNNLRAAMISKDKKDSKVRVAAKLEYKAAHLIAQQ